MWPTKRTSGVLVLAACMSAACGSGTGGGPAGPSTPQTQVGGTYDTAVTLTESSCGSVTVLPMPTTVTHTPGASRFSLTHAGNTYQGTLSPGGGFVTDPLQITDTNGSRLTLRLEGRFTTTGFDALLGADVQRSAGETCRYVVRWIGTKTGAPNVIP